MWADFPTSHHFQHSSFCCIFIYTSRPQPAPPSNSCDLLFVSSHHPRGLLGSWNSLHLSCQYSPPCPFLSRLLSHSVNRGCHFPGHNSVLCSSSGCAGSGLMLGQPGPVSTVRGSIILYTSLKAF